MKTQEDDNRRSFLKHLLVGATAVAGTATAVKPTKAKSLGPVSAKNEILYHESEDFKKYYRSLRS
jgi:hypothetical protein